MAGCRALSDTEINDIKQSFKSQRDRTLFVLGVRTGWRISQLLSIQLKHFMQYGKISKVIRIERKAVKGQDKSQESPLHPEAIEEITKLITEQYGTDLNPELYLFKSRNGQNKPLKRVQAHNILKDVINHLELQGKVATHSCRKSFSKKIYKASGHDLIVTQRALNHKHINSTINYLDTDKEEVDNLILSV